MSGRGSELALSGLQNAWDRWALSRAVRVMRPVERLCVTSTSTKCAALAARVGQIWSPAWSRERTPVLRRRSWCRLRSVGSAVGVELTRRMARGAQLAAELAVAVEEAVAVVLPWQAGRDLDRLYER